MIPRFSSFENFSFGVLTPKRNESPAESSQPFRSAIDFMYDKSKGVNSRSATDRISKLSLIIEKIIIIVIMLLICCLAEPR